MERPQKPLEEQLIVAEDELRKAEKKFHHGKNESQKFKK